MKKISVVLMCLIFASSFTACSNAKTSNNPTDSTTDGTEQTTNHIVAQNAPDFTASLGFNVKDYPRKDQLTNSVALGKLVGKMEFALPLGTIELRVAKDGGGDVSGVSNDLIDKVSNMDVKGVNVTVRSFKDDPSQMLYGWIKDGYIFSLRFKDIDESTHPSMITEQFVEQIVMDPVKAN